MGPVRVLALRALLGPSARTRAPRMHQGVHYTLPESRVYKLQALASLLARPRCENASPPPWATDTHTCPIKALAEPPLLRRTHHDETKEKVADDHGGDDDAALKEGVPAAWNAALHAEQVLVRDDGNVEKGVRSVRFVQQRGLLGSRSGDDFDLGRKGGGVSVVLGLGSVCRLFGDRQGGGGGGGRWLFGLEGGGVSSIVDGMLRAVGHFGG